MQIDSFKANILALVAQHDMTLTELARTAGYGSRQKLNNLFYRQNYTERDLKWIAEVFGVSPNSLVKKLTPEAWARKTANPLERVKENLKMICAEHGIKITQLIRALGYNEPVFRKAFWRNEPRMDIIDDICEYFGIDEEELTGPLNYKRYGEALIPRLSN